MILCPDLFFVSAPFALLCLLDRVGRLEAPQEASVHVDKQERGWLLAQAYQTVGGTHTHASETTAPRAGSGTRSCWPSSTRPRPRSPRRGCTRPSSAPSRTRTRGGAARGGRSLLSTPTPRPSPQTDTRRTPPPAAPAPAPARRTAAASCRRRPARRPRPASSPSAGRGTCQRTTGGRRAGRAAGCRRRRRATRGTCRRHRRLAEVSRGQTGVRNRAKRTQNYRQLEAEPGQPDPVAKVLGRGHGEGVMAVVVAGAVA